MSKTMSIADLAARKVELKEQQERIVQELALIDDKFRELGLGNHDAGDWTVQVRTNRRINNAAVEQAFPVVQFPHFYKPAVNLDALKANLAPVELDKFYSDGTPIVVVR